MMIRVGMIAFWELFFFFLESYCWARVGRMGGDRSEYLHYEKMTQNISNRVFRKLKCLYDNVQ